MAVMDLSREEIQAEIGTVRKVLHSSGAGTDMPRGSRDKAVDLGAPKADMVVKRNTGCC